MQAEIAPEDRKMILATASEQCTVCYGHGRMIRDVCHCVHRKAFRESLETYLMLREDAVSMGANVPLTLSVRGYVSYGMPLADYVIDFDQTARRALTRHQLALLSLYHIAGQPWHVCAPKLRLDRGEFFHQVYRTERLLGCALMETTPPLYPKARYFAGKRVEFGLPPRPGNVAPLMAAA